jgi:hypothetical protein
MTDSRPALAEHQLTMIRAFLRQHVTLFELIDRYDAEAQAHRFTLDPGRTSKRHPARPGPDARGPGARGAAHRGAGAGPEAGRRAAGDAHGQWDSVLGEG